MIAHTPGPWTPVGDAMKVFAGDMNICDIRGWGYLTGKGGGLGLYESEAQEIQRANTRLICAAPALYEAVKEYLEWGAMTGSDRDLFHEKFSTAIAKAEGK